MGRWTLRFNVTERRYSVFALPMNGKPPLPELADAFVPDKPMVHGSSYLGILKARLAKEDIALAARLAIKLARS